ncbi:MAG: hypothetical protein LBL41_03970 [Bifidobacteriaceae bacterium]|jgi:copper homeostasis protein|nr:hypothetical protein [Bifidobacteriaceae bacterium]
MQQYTLEICAGSARDCVKAENAGADRIELCSALSLGGLTPSLGLIRSVKKTCSLPIAAMLRPRAGGFYYTNDEFGEILYDANTFIDEGVEGIVFGFLSTDRAIDIERTEKLVKIAKDAKIEAVFHRAFDITPDLAESAKILIDLGVDRILTSGGKSNAGDGIPAIRALQDTYGDKVQFLAGSGVTLENARQILDEAGVSQIHTTAKADVNDIAYASEFIDYSELPTKKGIRHEVDEQIVRAFRSLSKE